MAEVSVSYDLPTLSKASAIEKASVGGDPTLLSILFLVIPAHALPVSSGTLKLAKETSGSHDHPESVPNGALRHSGQVLLHSTTSAATHLPYGGKFS